MPVLFLTNINEKSFNFQLNFQLFMKKSFKSIYKRIIFISLIMPNFTTDYKTKKYSQITSLSSIPHSIIGD